MALRRCVHKSHKLFNNGYNYKSIRYSTTTDIVYVNPSAAYDGYEIVNSRKKPTIPALGFGTWGCDHFSNDVMAESVDCAIKTGYKHLDCGRVFANEKEIGHVISDNISSGVISREEMFISSKLFNNEHAPPEGAPWRAIEETLRDLQISYLDSFLIHWPFRNSIHHPPFPYDVDKYFFTYKLMYELKLQGLCNSIGICNTTITKMNDLFRLCKKYNLVKPGILQVELHPYLQQSHILEFAEANDMIVTAAMPLGSPERPSRFRRDDDPVVMDDPVFKEISSECNRSVAQVIIRWHLQRGTVCIPKATEEWMIKENFETLNFELNQSQMERIDALDRHFRFARGEVFRWKEHQQWQEMWDYE